MSEDWVPFTELLSNIVDNRGRTCPVGAEGTPLIATNCIDGESMFPSFETTRFVSPETYRTWFRGHPLPGDIVFVCKGSPGRTALVPEPVPFCIAQDMVAVRADEHRVYPRFLFAALRSKVVQDQISNMHVGTMIPHFKKGDFGRLRIPLPTRSDQIGIGDLYFLLTERVRLLRETNATLEAIAQALFKSWFVDFDPVRAKSEGRAPEGMDEATAALFPDTFEDSPLGPIPTSWHVDKLGSMAAITKGKSYRSEELAPSSVALVTLKSFRRRGGYRRDGLKEFTGSFKPEQRVHPGDLVLSYTDVTQAADIIGRPALILPDDRYEVLAISLDVGVVRPRNQAEKSWFYGLLSAKSFRDHVLAHTTGTTVLHLLSSAVPAFEFVCPTPALVDTYTTRCDQLLKRIQTNAKAESLLTGLRDELLPRLISGKLRIAETVGAN